MPPKREVLGDLETSSDEGGPGRDEDVMDESGEEETDDEDDGEIKCVCGKAVDKGLMIQCEKCMIWQHGACLGIKKSKEVPENWYCKACQRQLELVFTTFSFFICM